MMMQNGRGRRTSVALVMVILGMGVAGAAPVPGPEDDSDETCWFNIDTEVAQCFETEDAFEAAVEDQTGGVLLFAGDPAPAARGGATVQATYILSTLYANSDRSGASTNITTSISTMCTSHNYTWNGMPAYWNDRVSAFRSYGTCMMKLYEHTYLTGSSYGPVVSSSNLGVMNDATSSFFVTG